MKKTFALFNGALLLLAFLGVQRANASAPPADVWPMYQYASSHNAVFEKPGFIVTWNYDAGAQINGGLAVVGNEIFFDTFDHAVIALDSRTGREIWKASTANVTMTTPIVYRGIVVVGTGRNGKLDKSGAAEYAYDPGRSKNQTWGRPEGDQIMAFDAVSGASKWSYHTVGEDMPSPAFTGKQVIFANGDLHAYSLDANSGALQWSRSLSGVSTMASANVADGVAFISTCEDVPYYSCSTAAINTEDGAIRWTSPYGNSDSSPTVGDRQVYVSGIVNVPGAFQYGGYTVVAALDEKSGRVLWTHRSGPGPYTTIGSSERAIAGTYHDGTYYQAITTTSEMLALNARTGKVRWSFHSIAPIKMSPVITSSGKLYVGDTAGVLYTINAKSGKLLYTRTFSAPFSTSPPVIVGGALFVVNGTHVMALNLNA